MLYFVRIAYVLNGLLNPWLQSMYVAALSACLNFPTDDVAYTVGSSTRTRCSLRTHASYSNNAALSHT
jgi:hypothetical protein